MSRRNNVRGPTSALTEFLRESGITAPRLVFPRRTSQRSGEPAQQADTSGAVPTATTSTANANGDAMDVDEEEEVEAPARPSRRATGKQRATGNDSEDLDASEGEINTPANKKRKLTKAVEARLKAKAKASARKKGIKVSDSEDDDEDEYNMPSSKPANAPPPPAGSLEECASCEKRFTVTKYTVAARPGPGWLCHECAKASGIDPFKKPTAPRKRKAPQERRKIVNFEEKDKIPTLSKLAIEVISKNIDDVEVFGEIGHINMENIAKVLARNRSLTPENAQLFYDVQNKQLTFFDATKLEPPALCTLASLNPNLTHLRLDFCGRMKDVVIQHWSQHLRYLTKIDLLGPFLVRSEAWIKFFEVVGPQLHTFRITQSPRFDLDCAEALAKHASGTLTDLRLAEVGLLKDDFLPILAGCTNLISVDFSYPGSGTSLSSDAVVDFLAAIGSTLEHLNLSGHEGLDDDLSTRGLQEHCKKLRSLGLAGLPELTDVPTAAFFKAWQGRNPPLERIDMSRCHKLSSAALDALLAHSGRNLVELNINSWRDTDSDTLSRIADSVPKIERLNVGFCRGVDDFVVKSLLEGVCKAHLRELKVYGCNRLTENCPKSRNINICGVEAHIAG
ncbi:RNI-like protein [Auriculariales sp. MPI-PUGE-AT-0066]|nr:RNI-like protein [Auriculariales sp. MPI-PUGE-AT-0066]